MQIHKYATYVLVAMSSNLSRPSRAFSVVSRCHPSISTTIVQNRQLYCPSSSSPSQLATYYDGYDRVMNKYDNNYNNNNKSMRLYSSFGGGGGDNNKKEEEGFLSKLANKAKSLVPFLQSDKEKEVAIQKRKAKEEVKGSIDNMLKDAPLAVRMMGKMISPIIGSVASNLAEAVAEQSRQMEDLLQDAQTFLQNDKDALQILGGEQQPIRVGSPISQSSSTTSINGNTTKNIQATFQVSGSYASGIATMMANQNGIQSLVLQAGGRNIRINLSSPSKRPTSYYGKTPNLGKNTNLGKDDIIDAEFVEKK